MRQEDRGGVQRLELTHDLLAGVVRASRDNRRQKEEAEKDRLALLRAQEEQQQALLKAKEEERLALERVQDQEKREREQRDLRRSRIAAAVFLVLMLVAFGAAVWVFRTQQEADEQREVAKKSQEEAQLRLDRIERGISLKHSLLSGKAIPRKYVDVRIRFKAAADEYPYKAANGGPTYRFTIFPDADSFPGGLKTVALITYAPSHPTFHHSLLETGPDRGFKASYDGVGCLDKVFVLVEYTSPDQPPI